MYTLPEKLAFRVTSLSIAHNFSNWRVSDPSKLGRVMFTGLLFNILHERYKGYLQEELEELEFSLFFDFNSMHSIDAAKEEYLDVSSELMFRGLERA